MCTLYVGWLCQCWLRRQCDLVLQQLEFRLDEDLNYMLHTRLAKDTEIQIVHFLETMCKQHKREVSKPSPAMRWTAAHVNTDYIVKVDDDVFLNIPTLWRRIHEMNLPKVCMYVVVRFLLSSFSAPAPPHTHHQYA